MLRTSFILVDDGRNMLKLIKGGLLTPVHFSKTAGRKSRPSRAAPGLAGGTAACRWAPQ